MRFNVLNIVLLLLLPVSIVAQDLEKVAKNKPVSVSGGINANSTFYAASGDTPQRDPFLWALNGNLNFKFFGVINAPFSFFISKENKTFNQPSYKQFGISPRYKSVTLHLGYRTMNFSQYTMSGIMFFGAGVEYAPKSGIVKAKTFYGRFARAVQYRARSINDNTIYLQPTFERWGYGTMITIGKKEQFVDLIMFKAVDDKNSITLPDSVTDVAPMENFVLGINTRNRIAKKLSLKNEFALSALSSDIRMPEMYTETYSYANNLGFLFSPRTSSSFNNVINSSLNYSLGSYSLGLAYKRIAPGYRSLGTTFINNDVEEITANFSGTFFKNKISFTGNVGTQRDNLDNKKLATSRRIISSANISYIVSSDFNVSLLFSNFNTSSQPVAIYLLDSIKYSQTTSNVTLSSVYSFGDSTVSRTINFSTTYQKGNTLNQTGTEVTDVSNSYLNANISYSAGIIKQKINTTFSITYSRFTTQTDVSTIGPTIGVNKTTKNDKLRLGVSTSFLKTMGNNVNMMVNARAYSNYKLNKHHSFKVMLSLLDKNDKQTGNSIHFQGNLTYVYVL